MYVYQSFHQHLIVICWFLFYRETLVKAMVVMNNISSAMQNGEYDANIPQEKVRE